MHFWDKINVKELLIEDEAHTFPPFTEEELKQTEQSIGWKFPRSYLELLKIQNGGMINFDEFDESWLSVIYGISSKRAALLICMTTGSPNGNIRTSVFHLAKHNPQDTTCILWISAWWMKTANLALSW